MLNDDLTPSYMKKSFTCPRCGAFSAMEWNHLMLNYTKYASLSISGCHACKLHSIWTSKNEKSDTYPLGGTFGNGRELIYPSLCNAPTPEPDIPESIRADFEEARLVFAVSPRAAAALLRLCVQKLCQELLGKKGDIHTQIGELVELGLPSRVLKAFDTIRIFGNESVHPGTVNLNDAPEVGLALFSLLNLAIRHCITEEKELEAIRALTPEKKRRDL